MVGGTNQSMNRSLLVLPSSKPLRLLSKNLSDDYLPQETQSIGKNFFPFVILDIQFLVSWRMIKFSHKSPLLKRVYEGQVLTPTIKHFTPLLRFGMITIRMFAKNLLFVHESAELQKSIPIPFFRPLFHSQYFGNK